VVSDQVQLALIGAVVPTIAALGALVASLGGIYFNLKNSRKIDAANTRLDDVVPKIAELAVNTNDIRDKLVASTRVAALAEGREEGRVAAKEEAKQDASL